MAELTLMSSDSLTDWLFFFFLESREYKNNNKYTRFLLLKEMCMVHDFQNAMAYGCLGGSYI